MDKMIMTMGFLAGSSIAGMRRAKEPVAYLYNGVRLPKLPEYDKEAFPYAVVYKRLNTSFYMLVVSAEPMTCNSDGNLNIGMFGSPIGAGDYLSFKAGAGEWAESSQGGIGSAAVIWTNRNLNYNSEAGGGLAIEASAEPIPVYE